MMVHGSQIGENWKNTRRIPGPGWATATHSFMQNKPNFGIFGANNEGLSEKQSQTKPIGGGPTRIRFAWKVGSCILFFL